MSRLDINTLSQRRVELNLFLLLRHRFRSLRKPTRSSGPWTFLPSCLLSCCSFDLDRDRDGGELNDWNWKFGGRELAVRGGYDKADDAVADSIGGWDEVSTMASSRGSRETEEREGRERGELTRSVLVL